MNMFDQEEVTIFLNAMLVEEYTRKCITSQYTLWATLNPEVIYLELNELKGNEQKDPCVPSCLL